MYSKGIGKAGNTWKVYHTHDFPYNQLGITGIHHVNWSEWGQQVQVWLLSTTVYAYTTSGTYMLQNSNLAIQSNT